MNQIFITDFIFAKQNKVITRGVKAVDFIGKPAFRDINFTADNRLNPVRFSGLIKFHRAEHITVVGNRKRRLPEFFCSRTKAFQTASTVQKAVFRMQM